MKLVVHGLAVPVRLPEWPFGSGLGHRIPAPERAFDIGCQVVLLQQEGDELLRPLLVLRVLENDTGLDRGAIDHLRAVGLVRKTCGADQLFVILLRGRALLGRQGCVVRVVEPFGRDRDRRVVRQHRRLVVEGDVVVRVFPVRRRRRRAALGVDVGVVLQRADQAGLDLRVVDEQLAVVVDELDVVGVHEGQEREERVARIDSQRLADAVDALAGLLAVRGLHLVAPEAPVVMPLVRDVGLLEASSVQHVGPVLDVHRLLLDRERVVRAALRLVVASASGRKLALIGLITSLTSSSRPSNAHLPVTWKSNTSP